MEDLQSTLQAVLSDPEQMSRLAALAENLGLKPPDTEPGPEPQNAPPPEAGLASLLGQLSAAGGSEARVLSALRPALSEAGQARVDRALRAAALSRIAAQLLARRGDAHV